MLPAEGTPLTPTGARARQLLGRELSRSEYQQHKGLVQTVLDWISGQLDHLLSGTTGTLPAIGWLVGLLLVIMIVTLAATGLRRGRARAGDVPGDAVLGDHATSAAELRVRAAAAEHRADLDAATLDYFRAIAVRGVERALVEPSPGLTAHEIARVLAARFPPATDELTRAAGVFDAVLYGGQTADSTGCARMRDLDDRLESARPEPLRTGRSV